MKFEIKSWLDGGLLFELECGSLKLCVEAAVKAKANLVGANLVRANLDGANLDGANLVRANLVGANLVGANLVRANLAVANLVGANLYGANLVRANLVGANLAVANLVRANLVGANLVGANLAVANLDGATKLSDETRLPTGETFGEYKSIVLPALMTAGGKSFEEVAASWDCHEWANCPMHLAYDFDGNYEFASALVKLMRPRIEQFVKLFDAKLLPCPSMPTAAAAE